MKMSDSKGLKVILFIAGVLILIPGMFALFSPEGFTARNDIDIAGNVSLLNDYRGTGGLMIGTGIIILLGLIHSRMTFTSTVVATVMYLAMAIGRILSIALDGIPSDTLIKATVAETVIGLLAVFALIKYREQE